MGPYEPIWALMGPPGQVLAGPDMSDFRLLVEFCMFWMQNKVFNEIINLLTKIGPLWAHKGPYGPIWAPTRTGPQPGLGPNPGPGRVGGRRVGTGGGNTELG